MQLPDDLREGISRALEGVSRKALGERAARISEMYRAGGGSGAAIRDDADALAYVVARMPATYAAVRNVLGRLRERCPEFAPGAVLDLGAGPGTAGWAVADAWPGVERITQVDANAALMRLGKLLAASPECAALRGADWRMANIGRGFDVGVSADLTIVSYTLAELGPAQIEGLTAGAWRGCTGALVIVEPGTPAGYARILQARNILKRENARIAAPCPHEMKCPLLAEDWCHFVQRVARSRDHMLVKGAEAPYEDEKFSYLIAVREGLFRAAEAGRILARTEIGKAGFTAKVCRTDGTAGLVTIARRDALGFKRARKREWGDEL